MNELEEKEKSPPRRKRLPVWAMVLLDLLALAAALNVFALFHHVLPRRMEPTETRVSVLPTPTAVPTAPPVTTPAPTQGQGDDLPPEETEEPVPEKTGWAKTFEEHFTDEIVVTENSYSSPNVAIEITEHVIENDDRRNVYFVADIYITDIRSFQAHLAHNTYGQGILQDVLEMAADSNALAAMTGDVYAFQGASLMLRNGVLYRDGRWQTFQTHCVLYYDGTMVTYGPEELDLDQALADGAWQIWSFGPILLNNEGGFPDSFDAGMAVNGANPRSGVGYFEPGHYCFVVVDGRRPSYSYGMTFEEFAGIFQELGCKTAYNLDGGGSAVMTFGDRLVNLPSGGGREISDIMLIAEPPAEDTPEQTEEEVGK